MKEIKVLPIKVEATYEGKKFRMEWAGKHAILANTDLYDVEIDEEKGRLWNQPEELNLAFTAWNLNLRKPSKHPLYLPIITLIRALKGEID